MSSGEGLESDIGMGDLDWGIILKWLEECSANNKIKSEHSRMNRTKEEDVQEQEDVDQECYRNEDVRIITVDEI